MTDWSEVTERQADKHQRSRLLTLDAEHVARLDALRAALADLDALDSPALDDLAAAIVGMPRLNAWLLGVSDVLDRARLATERKWTPEDHA
jgi:hypothetical protein